MPDKLSLFSRKPEPFSLDNGKTVYLRRFAAVDRFAWAEYAEDSKENDKDLRYAGKVNAKLLALTLCDQDSTLIFGPDAVEEVLSTVAEADFWTLGNEARYINGMGDRAEQDTKKNSPSQTTTVSSPNSPENSTLP